MIIFGVCVLELFLFIVKKKKENSFEMKIPFP